MGGTGRGAGGSVEIQDAADGGDHAVGAGLREPLELLVVRHRHVGLGDPQHRRIELVERVALDHVHHLGADAAVAPALLDLRSLRPLDEGAIVGSSSGRSERRSSTSAETPSCSASCSAALSATATVFEWQITVTSPPGRFTSACPIGTRCSPSGTSPLTLYSISPSSTMTGLASRIADLSSPFASAGVAGATTLSPGMCDNHASHAWECCAASCNAAPFGPRNTMGIGICPPDSYRIFAAELTIWSSARTAKFHVMNSITGRKPAIAAPTPIPANPSSAIGVSTTRWAPNSSSNPRLTLYAPW